MVKKLLKEHFSHVSILYVEDEEEERTLTCAWLRRYFTNVVEATNGVEALEHYKNSTFDLVISDITMPKMNGITMTKEMKKMNPEQQIIIISGHKESDFLFDLLDIGIDAYIMKPIDTTVLLKTLWDTTKQISAMRHRCHLDELIVSITDDDIRGAMIR